MVGPKASKQAFELPKIKYIYTQPGRDRFNFYDVKFWPYSKSEFDEPIFAVVGQTEVIIGRLSAAKTRPTVTILHHLTDIFIKQNHDVLGLNSCAWAYMDPHKPLLIVAGASGLLRVVNAVKGRVCSPRIQHINASINDVAVHPLYPWIFATASQDGQIRIWDLRRCLLPHPTMIIICGGGIDGPRAGVLSVSWHHTGRYLVSAGFDHQVHVWTIPDLHDRSPFWRTIDPKRVKRRMFEAMIIYYPHFITKALHTNYIDCVKFFGDLILSKAATEDKIVLWKITGFDSKRPPPHRMTAPSFRMRLDTRNGFMRTVVTDKDGTKTWTVASEFQNKPPYQRLLEFATPYSEPFYLRFGLLLPSPAYPDLHPVLAYGNAASELRFWDLERLIEGHAGKHDQAGKSRRGRKRKRPQAEANPPPEVRPRKRRPFQLIPGRRSSRLKGEPPAVKLEDVEIKWGAVKIKDEVVKIEQGTIEVKTEVVKTEEGSGEIKREDVNVEYESPEPVRLIPPTSTTDDVKSWAPLTLVGGSTSPYSDILRIPWTTLSVLEGTSTIPAREMAGSQQFHILLDNVGTDKPVLSSSPLPEKTGRADSGSIQLTDMAYATPFLLSSLRRRSTRSKADVVKPSRDVSVSKTESSSTPGRRSTRSRRHITQPRVDTPDIKMELSPPLDTPDIKIESSPSPVGRPTRSKPDITQPPADVANSKTIYPPAITSRSTRSKARSFQADPNISSSKPSSSTTPDRMPAPSNSDDVPPSLDTLDGISSFPAEAVRRSHPSKTDSIQMSQDLIHAEKGGNAVRRTTRSTPRTAPPAPTASNAASDTIGIRKSARLKTRPRVTLPSPAASDISGDTTATRRSPSATAQAASGDVRDAEPAVSSMLSPPQTPSPTPPPPDTSREVAPVRRSTRPKQKATRSLSKTPDATRDTPPVKSHVPSPPPAMLQPPDASGVTGEPIRPRRIIPETQIIVVHDSSSESEEEQYSAPDLGKWSHRPPQFAKEKSRSPDHGEGVFESIETGQGSSNALKVERERSTSWDSEDTTSDISMTERVRSLTRESEETSGTFERDTKRSATPDMKEESPESTKIDRGYSDMEQNPPAAVTLPESTYELHLEPHFHGLSSKMDPKRAVSPVPDPLDDPHIPVKAHQRVLLNKLQYKKQALFVTRAAEWSPCGRWCIVAGESTKSPTNGWGGFAVLYRPGLPVKDEVKDEFGDEFGQLKPMLNKIRAILLDLHDREEVGARIKELQTILQQIKKSPKKFDDGVERLQVMLTELLLIHPTALEETLKKIANVLDKLEGSEGLKGHREFEDDEEEYEEHEEYAGNEEFEDDEESASGATYEDAEESTEYEEMERFEQFEDAEEPTDTEEMDEPGQFEDAEAREYDKKAAYGNVKFAFDAWQYFDDEEEEDEDMYGGVPFSDAEAREDDESSAYDTEESTYDTGDEDMYAGEPFSDVEARKSDEESAYNTEDEESETDISEDEFYPARLRSARRYC
ncbi:uncharacterized protein Z520_06987 [Fonsecaea multimorphosa CBS 102226]|uniref:Uncharacterized protein n=1 Tax=Fonsecaea multimorphosa CBS 102226 TaxID=1442371 RepID=A0A0D2H6P7_9EURO|nr:uncharacterized protein Z520_06987 [Fonsecaea multimorphosa CBS 102226]KIX97535.1 hypothetical protein Z520_06987 [Fonsecaea multimorphosa CBS 102226]OAL23495.1 hypothetical protein AYO22_06545 [Fonsecaea multimorphosa]